jgi:hypothetical protein
LRHGGGKPYKHGLWHADLHRRAFKLDELRQCID